MHRPTALAFMHARSGAVPSVWLKLAALLLGCIVVLAGCGGGSGSAGFAGFGLNLTQPPAGLAYGMTSAVYEVGQPIVPNRPSASGGAVERYAVAPELPAGLALDAVTGVISGTPTALAPSAVYVVTAGNAGGSATARVQIEVRHTPAAPSGLSYRDAAAIYTVGEAIPANLPGSSGGPVASYSIAPALPAGLAFDTQTGAITGTPTAVAADAAFTVTGTNAAGSASVTLHIAIQAAPVAPASVTYAAPRVLYVEADAIVPNTPLVTGGTPSAYSVAPPLPAGLSINAATGAITGTPAAIQAAATYTVTAGNSAGSVQAQVEIAVTGKGGWTSKASLPAGRHYMPVVRLASGKVLTIGGFASGSALASVLVYDPVADSWSAAASMGVARSDASATVLTDGRVLVAGGDGPGGISLATAEIYDPATDTWSATASMAMPRTRSTATLLPSGKVLLIGGYNWTPVVSFTQTAELYDPVANTWTLMATPLSVPRSQHAAQLLTGGTEVLVIGGANGSGFVETAERFPVNDSGATTPVPGTLPGANMYNSARLHDGSVLAAGDGTTTAVRFDPSGSGWTTSVRSGSRLIPTMTTMPDGRVLLAGGADTLGVRLNTAEIYNPDFNAWTPASAMSSARGAASAVLLNDGSVLMVGGYLGTDGEVSGVERFVP